MEKIFEALDKFSKQLDVAIAENNKLMQCARALENQLKILQSDCEKVDNA